MGKPDPPQPPDPKETAAAQTGTNVSTAIANAILQNPNQSTPYGDLSYSFGGAPDYSGIPEVETFTTPGTQGATAAPSYGYNREGGGGAPAPSGGSGPTTQYRVGDNTFGSLDEANAYRTQQASGNDNYTWTDPSTGETYTIPRVSVEQSLSPEQQAIFESEMSAKGNLADIADTQSARLFDLLNQPFTLDDLPDRASFDPSQTPEMGRVGSGPSLQTGVDPQIGVTGSFDAGGPIQTSVNTPQGYTNNVARGDITRSVNLPGVSSGSIGSGFQMPDIQSEIDLSQAGEIRRDAGLQGIRDVPSGSDIPGINYNRSDLGDIQNSFDQGRDIQFETGDAGDITRTYGTDFSEDRQRVEDALMERMNPQLDRRREQLEARLASQGIRIGSEQYQDAMYDLNRGSNDARLGAILSAGQEQSRLADLEARRAGFENAAQQQAFNQLRSRQDAFNSAQGQEFGQNLTGAQFANAAQAQGAGQTLQQDQLDLQAQTSNADVQRLFAQLGISRDVAAGNQQLQGAQFENQAQQQAADQILSEGQFGQNAAQIEGQLGLGADRNSIQAQTATADNQLRADLANQQAALQEAQFGNQAQAQDFTQGLANANLNNQTLSEIFGNNLAAGQFANAAQGQQFGQNAAQAGFQNDASGQELQQLLAQMTAGNDAEQQMFQNEQAGVSQNNAAAQQDFSNYMAGLGQTNADRASALEEMFAERNQPINEIAALLGGSGVQQPQFTNPNIGGIPTTDYAGIVNENFRQQQANYQSENQRFNDLWGGIFGLGAGGLSGGYF